MQKVIVPFIFSMLVMKCNAGSEQTANGDQSSDKKIEIPVMVVNLLEPEDNNSCCCFGICPKSKDPVDRFKKISPKLPSEVRRIFGKDHELGLNTLERMADIMVLRTLYNEFSTYFKNHEQEINDNEKLKVFFYIYQTMRGAEDVILGASSGSVGAKKLKDMLINGLAKKEYEMTDWLYHNVWPHINYKPFKKVYTSKEMKLAYQQRCEQVGTKSDSAVN